MSRVKLQTLFIQTIVALNAHVYSSESKTKVKSQKRQIILRFLDTSSAPHQPAMKATYMHISL